MNIQVEISCEATALYPAQHTLFCLFNVAGIKETHTGQVGMQWIMVIMVIVMSPWKGQGSIPPKKAEISGSLFKQLVYSKGIIILFTILFQPHGVEIYIEHR